jgi:hypothetical protein
MVIDYSLFESIVFMFLYILQFLKFLNQFFSLTKGINRFTKGSISL